ncbi:hypothetical protein EVJ50_06790 [Synechococcus sp. RSCCF101]|uniref:porin n=1 Tax=Synechococcus sp. RSCCF101 TaxID=2511069 RepID=UPI0012456285|nr:porin [Synechococcus sp. RSCCF101]QEY31987.1 hypothetical protein EVJ50_06790 [Synechococcus sp. RSCCF101]
MLLESVMLLLASSVMGVLISAKSFAQPAETITGQRFLAFNRSHQVIYLNELLRGQSTLVDACAPDLTREALAAYLEGWIQSNPISLSRPVNVSLQRALDQRCHNHPQPTGVDTSSSLWSLPDSRATEVSTASTRFPAPFSASTTLGQSVADPNQPLLPEFPRLSGIVKLGLINQTSFSRSESENNYNDLFADSTLAASLFLSPEIYFYGAVRYLPLVFPPSPRRDRVFEDQALIIGALNLNYENDNFLLSAGKGTTFFSTAFRSAPGIWGRDVAERFVRVPVRNGLLASGKLTTSNVGNHALTGGVFYLDTSPLSKPLLSDFPKPELEGGGPSNTGDLSSFFVVLDSSSFSQAPGLRTHFGFMKQRVNRIQPRALPFPTPANEIADEYRGVVSAQWPLELGEDQRITPFVEYARITNSGGLRDSTRDVMTASVQYFAGQWNVAIASSLWRDNNPGQAKTTNTQIQLSGGYTFDSGLSVDIGYRYLDSSDLGLRDTHAAGIWMQYQLGF